MTSAGAARRTNRAILVVVAVTSLTAGLAAILGDRGGDGGSAPSTTERPQRDGVGTRPAETARSWFDHGNAREQFDYAMSSLSCAAMDEYLTTDLCATATSRSGSFMLVGTESFWDPDEKDSDGLAWIPFDFTAFTMRRDGAPRAVSVLDGYTEKAYTGLKAQLDMYRAVVDGDEVLVVVKRLADGAGDPYDFTESVQVIAASPTGAPTLVASYEGARISVTSTGDALVVSSLRYASPTNGEGDTEEEWYTIITLAPSERDPYSWDERVTSGPRGKVPEGDIALVGTHTFPVGRDGRDPSEASA